MQPWPATLVAPTVGTLYAVPRFSSGFDTVVSHSSDPGLLKSHLQKCFNLFLLLPQFFLDPLFPAAVLLFAADPQTLSLFLILPKNFGSVEPNLFLFHFKLFLILHPLHAGLRRVGPSICTAGTAWYAYGA